MSVQNNGRKELLKFVPCDPQDPPSASRRLDEEPRVLENPLEPTRTVLMLSQAGASYTYSERRCCCCRCQRHHSRPQRRLRSTACRSRNHTLAISNILSSVIQKETVPRLWRRRARTTDLATGKRYVATQARGEPLAEGGFQYRNPYGTTPSI